MFTITIPTITNISLKIDESSNQLYYNLSGENIPLSGNYYSQEQIQEFLNNKQSVLNYIDSEQFILSSNMFINCTTTLTSLEYFIPSGLIDAYCVFNTGNDFTYSISGTSLNVNKSFLFDSDKTYIIAVNNNLVLWNELTTL